MPRWAVVPNAPVIHTHECTERREQRRSVGSIEALPFQGAVVSPWDRTTASVPGILFKYPLFLGKKQKEFLVSVLYSDSRVSNPVPLAGRQGPEREGGSPGAHAALRGALPSQRGHELLLTQGGSSFSVGGALLDRGGEWGRSRGTDIF